MKKITMMALFALAAVLAGCEPPREPLRIVSSPWPGYEPLYLARDLGYLDPSSVRLNELPSANITLEAFSNGSAEIATLTLDETLSLLDEGKKLRILLVLDSSNGADAVMARPAIKTLADLKGKRIAMENITLGVYMLNRTLDAAGLRHGDVTVIPMPEDKHEKAYRQDKIDAAVTMEPYKTLLAEAGAHAVFDSSRIPNEIFDVMVVREDVYYARREELCGIVRQWFRALDYVRENPEEAAARMGKRLGMQLDTFKTMTGGLIQPSRDDNRRLLGGSKPDLLGSAQRLAAVMQREQLTKGLVDATLSVDPGFQSCVK